MIRPFAALLTLTGILFASDAEAQHFFRRGHTRTTTSSSSTRPNYEGTASPTAETRLYSYSYYTRSALPARTYVGYGDNDFPFQGAPYGHPYDPWTYSTLSGSYGQGLARYYVPPVK